MGYQAGILKDVQNYVNKTCNKRQAHDSDIGCYDIDYEGTWILIENPCDR